MHIQNQSRQRTRPNNRQYKLWSQLRCPMFQCAVSSTNNNSTYLRTTPAIPIPLHCFIQLCKQLTYRTLELQVRFIWLCSEIL